MTTSQPKQGQVKSVNVGTAEPVGGRVDGELSGIDKRAVQQIEVRDPGNRRDGLASGVVSDAIVDREDHGGQRQAVYLFTREQLTYWEGELQRALPDGTFGENITTLALDVDEMVMGSTLRVGEDVHLQVCGPRIPCGTFAWHLGERGWVKRFTQHGRPGAYCSVTSPGLIKPGDPVVVVTIAEHGIDVMDVFRAFSGDLDAARLVLAAGCLAEDDQSELVSRVARRTSAG